ncbi:MAG TPA: D-glycero-beta-D-manno-heptose 1-phosphate adenylyltransferase [Flavisolibacter sp.]|nr:D-glycero-beta-D-manno-heptose 1-phosphate adenylyltransferase [Flavisolibacter sp.]
MKPEHDFQTKILPLSDLQRKANEWRKAGKTIVFTNGCFDILHTGHIASLTEAAKQGDVLVVALNSDTSVKELKGETRPINNEMARATVMAALGIVDAVTIFSEPTPRELILSILPDVLVKGGDYKVEEIAGAKEVIENGGKVVINPIVEGFSTTSIIEKMKS